MRQGEGGNGSDRMIDNFSLGLTHVLMLLAAWRLLHRLDLDHEGIVTRVKRGWGRK